MDDQASADHIGCTDFVCEKSHSCIAVIGKQHGEVADVVAMWLLCRVPMTACCRKGIFRISDGANAMLMQMKAKWPDLRLIASGWLESGEAADFHEHFGAVGDIGKNNVAMQVRCQWTTLNFGKRLSFSPSML